ncbi:hypothetical protein NPA08_01590 [Mycoplasmopsis citelli]|uniref:hypothetical protein n=1 Tax=Mycoplasmopsis citelli TaxID=171281 RepID=UPI0021156F4C|nr:hypothetical protein [Mycoplasmopsis citelli]UUD36509.1 hypothetical protein NPA08_01590 [Mycoplasmopsis citelli]
MKNQFKRLLLLSSGLISLLFVATHCSSNFQNDNLENQLDKINKISETKGQNSEEDNNVLEHNQHQRIPVMENNSENSENIITEVQFPRGVDSQGNLIIFGKSSWNPKKTKRELVKELKAVSTDYKKRINDINQLKLLRELLVWDSIDTFYEGTEDNLQLYLYPRRYIVDKDNKNKENPQVIGKILPVAVPSKYIYKNEKAEQELDSKLSVAQKKSKKELLELRELIIKKLFIKENAVSRVPAHYDLKILSNNPKRQYETFQIQVSTLIFTIDYLLKHHIFDSHINLLLKGVQLKDEQGNTSEKETDKFFTTQFSSFPSNKNLVGYGFGFSYLYLLWKSQSLIDLENKS